jgi:hypothetical protein
MSEQVLASQEVLKSMEWVTKIDNFTILTSSPPLWADCIEYVGTLTSYNPMGLYGVLQG